MKEKTKVGDSEKKIDEKMARRKERKLTKRKAKNDAEMKAYLKRKKERERLEQIQIARDKQRRGWEEEEQYLKAKMYLEKKKKNK